MFEHSAQKNADAIALILDNQQFTYAELLVLSENIAAFLITQNIQSGDIVGICLKRSPIMVASVLATLKIGATYLPLDAEYPEARLKFMVNHSQVKTILTQRKFAHLFSFDSCTSHFIVSNNLLEDLEKTYFLLQFHKEIDDSLAKELVIRTEIATRSKESYEFGSIYFEEFYNTQRDVISARIQAVNSSLVVRTEEFALKLILQVEDNLAPLDLAVADFYNATLDFPVDARIAMDVAAVNSREVDQYDYLVLAARNTRRGVGISWISWGGVGFDYFARVSIANSEIKKIEMQKSKATYEVKNQVAAMYEEIAKHKEKMALQNELLDMAKAQYATAITSHDNLLTTLIAVKKAELGLLGAQRDSRRLQYELELKYIKLKRLMSADMLTNEIPRI